MDRIQIRISFRKAWWICPKCGQEDFTDLNVGTPSVYEHNCSKCGQWFNSFKECQGVLTYPYDAYKDGKIKQEDIDKSKQDKVDQWVYDVKNPVPYVEPTKADYERMIADRQAEVADLQAKVNTIDKKVIGEIG
jgi:transcription elongation factor Elf1